MNISDFLLLPSKNEALGIILLVEDLAAGNILVVTQGEGREDLLALDEDIGILYSVENEHEIAREIIHRHANSRSSEIQQKCREIAKVHFSEDQYVNQLLSVYKEITIQ
ncbi:MAG: glycosyltransferase [bacterium]